MMMMVYVCVCMGGGGFGCPTALTPAAEKIKLVVNDDSLEARNSIKETKIADSVLFSLFMCSNVMGQH